MEIAKNIETAANAQKLTLVTDDGYENNLHRTVAKDALGNYYDYVTSEQAFVLRTVDRLVNIILYGGEGNFTVTDVTKTVQRNIQVAANIQGLTLVTDDEYENSRHRTVAKDALGNYYDYNSNNQEFVLRTVEGLTDAIHNGKGNFTVTDITRTVDRNLNIAKTIENAASAQRLTLVTDDEYENFLHRTVAKDALGYYYDYNAENQEFVLRTVDRIRDTILYGGDGNFTVTDITRTVDRNLNIAKTIENAASAQDLTLVTDDEYENFLHRTVAKDALGNYYDYDAKNQEFVLRTVDRIRDTILYGGDGNFTVTDITRTVQRNLEIAANAQNNSENGQSSDGVINSDTPTEEDIIGANDYQRFIDHERDLGKNGGGTFLGDSQETGNTSNFKDIIDEIYNNRYMDFIEKEKRLHQGVEAVVDLPTVTMGSSKSDKLRSIDEATIFQFDVKSGKGGGSDKVYYSDSADAIVFSVEDEVAGDKVADKISTVTKKGKDLVISYNSYKKGKKTVTDKVTVINYFKKSSDEALKDIAIVSKDGEVLDTINLQEQVLKFSGKGKISDTVFNDKITGSKKNDTYTFQNGGNDVVTDKKGKDKYNVLLNEVDKVTINDKKGKDTLILKDVNKSDAVFGFNVVKTEADGETVFTIGKDLFVMSENENSGLVQINNFFKSFTDKDGDGTIDSFKYGSGRVENFKYADGSGFSFNADNINEIKSNVAAWLNDHEGYASANEVFANGSKEDVQSLIAAYAGNYQA